MNKIKNRLKKIEAQIGNTDPVHCDCKRGLEVHVIMPSENNERGECSVCAGVCLLDEGLPCPDCGKPMAVDIIKVEFYELPNQN